MTCPHCDQAAEFHSHRPHTPQSLVGPVRYERAYYLCRRCGPGLFPFDQQAGLTARQLTPGLERVVTLAGTVADSFEKALRALASGWPSSSRLGQTWGAQGTWPRHKDYKGRTCAYIEMDATGVRQQGPGGVRAEGRMAYVGLVCNPAPEWLWPDDKRTPMPAR